MSIAVRRRLPPVRCTTPVQQRPAVEGTCLAFIAVHGAYSCRLRSDAAAGIHPDPTRTSMALLKVFGLFVFTAVEQKRV